MPAEENLFAYLISDALVSPPLFKSIISPESIRDNSKRGTMFNFLRKSLMVAIQITMFSTFAIAQVQISGKVLDAETNEPLAGASVFVDGSTIGTSTNQNGEFTLELPQKTGLITISFVGYQTKEVNPDVQNEMIIYLTPSLSMEELIIKGVRAEPNDPVAQSTIQKAELEKTYKGEHPVFFLEELTPSVVSSSESGTNLSNYGSMRLRGISQERINFTLNGVPLNDMIDHGVFFSNFSDIANSFESVQVQRGVGTSSNGAASYAGSVNFESVNLEGREQGAEIGLGVGSFGTYRMNGNISSGMINDRWAFFGNYSRIYSDGYRYNTSANSSSFFFSAGYFGDKNLFKVNIFDAGSKNGLGYSPVLLSDLEADPRTNYLNENDKDDFGQRFVQLQHTHLFNENWKSTSSLYYGGASGDFLFTYEDGGLQQINFPLRNDHYGLITNIFYESENLDVSSGIHVYQFDRTNEESFAPDFENPYYFETSDKKEISWFSKSERSFGDFSVFSELQIRYLKLSIQPDYNFIGIAPEGDIEKDWTFVNPKIGFSYEINENLNAYASYGRAGREPTKIDIFGGFNLNSGNYAQARANTFDPEYVNDYEAGIRFNSQSASVGANLFFMDFKDEIAPIGELLPFGVQKRDNIPNSYRTGIELDWNLLPTEFEIVGFQGTLTYMKSEIEEFEDQTDNTVYRNKTPILSPEWIINGRTNFFITEEFTISIIEKYVSESFLELTNDPSLTTPSYFKTDISVRYETNRFQIRLEFNNVFDKEYYTNGAPVDVDFDGTVDGPGYQVNAPRNVFGSVVVKF